MVMRKWWACNTCTTPRCRWKPRTVRERGLCEKYQPIDRSFRMLDHLMDKDPANTMTVLHEFGLGVAETKFKHNQKGYKTYVKRTKGRKKYRRG
jgi:hypothetical protein